MIPRPDTDCTLPDGQYTVRLVIEAALAMKETRLIADLGEESDIAIEDVFAGVMGLSASAAMLKLNTSELDLPTMLAMSSRQTGRFYDGQGVELLQFLGKVLSVYLERYLTDLSM